MSHFTNETEKFSCQNIVWIGNIFRFFSWSILFLQNKDKQSQKKIDNLDIYAFFC